MTLLLHNRTKYGCSRPGFATLALRAQKALTFKEETISIAIISKNEMRKINRAYRGKDEPTDVLAFDYGEVLLCPAHIKEKYGLKTAREIEIKLRELFVHGLAHIGGFDHATKRREAEMREIEKKIFT